jgi:Phage protein Gp138 N-terminal domain
MSKVTGAPTSAPNLITVIQHVANDMLSSIHTTFPGQIEKYDFTTAKADIKPLLNIVYPDNSTMEFPVIPNVPIVWPRTSLGSISFPLQRGDGCLVVCAERSIDDWLTLGGQNSPSDPRSFDLNDAIAIPGLYSFASTTKISGNDKFEIHYKDQQITIDQNGEIDLGSGSLRRLIDERIQAALNDHGHEYVSPTGPLVTSKPLTTGIVPPTMSAALLVLGDGTLQTPVTTSKVKAQ